MRILFVTQLYPPDPGGPATYAKLLEEVLPHHGITVQVVKFGDVRHLPRFVRHIVFMANIFAAAPNHDLVFVQDAVGCGLPAMIAARLRGKPLVVRLPGDYAWEQATQRFGVSEDIDSFQKNRRSLRAWVLHLIQRWVASRATLVIVASQYFAGIVRGWGVPEDRLRIVYHGLDFSEPVRIPETSIQGPIMFSLGRFVPWKGFLFLVELLVELPEWSLVIAGDGPQRPLVEQRARELGVSDRLILTGVIEHSLVLGWYRRADVFVLNSSQENFSFQTLEGMISGTPVIATAIGAIPELITDGIEGRLLEPNDRAGFLAAIQSVAAEPSVWKKRTEAAKQKAEHFSTDRMLSGTAAVLVESLHSRPSQA